MSYNLTPAELDAIRTSLNKEWSDLVYHSGRMTVWKGNMDVVDGLLQMVFFVVVGEDMKLNETLVIHKEHIKLGEAALNKIDEFLKIKAAREIVEEMLTHRAIMELSHKGLEVVMRIGRDFGITAKLEEGTDDGNEDTLPV